MEEKKFEPSINYVSIFYNTKLLCEYNKLNDNPNASKDFPTYNTNLQYQKLSNKMLRKVKKDSEMSLIYEKKLPIYYKNKSNITVMCFTTMGYPFTSAFEFMKQILLSFQNKYSDFVLQKANSFSLNRDFKSILKEKINFFNANQDTISVKSLNYFKDSLIETKDQLLNTLDQVGERGEVLEHALKKADNLKEESTTYYANTKKVKKVFAGFGFATIFLILLRIFGFYFLAYVLCGGSNLPNCFK